MDDRKRTLAAITVIIGFLVLVAIVVGALVSGKKILSPVPEDEAIKIIFVTPTPVSSPSPTETPTATPKATRTPTKTPTPKPSATPTATTSATPTP